MIALDLAMIALSVLLVLYWLVAMAIANGECGSCRRRFYCVTGCDEVSRSLDDADEDLRHQEGR